MIKEVRNQDFQYVNELEVRDRAYNYFVNTYKLGKDKEENIKLMENHGYIFEQKYTVNIEVENFKSYPILLMIERVNIYKLLMK